MSPAKQGYDAGVAGQGQNANDLCSATQAKTVWTNNFTMPIIPNPGLGAGLDLAGGPNGGGIAGYDPTCLSYDKCPALQAPPVFTYNPTTAVEPWTGVTLDQAQALLCQALQPASPFGPSSAQGWAGWGESDEVNVFYNVNNRQLTDMFFFPGYIGNLVGTCTHGVATKGAVGECPGNDGDKTVFTVSMYNNYFMQVQKPGTAPFPNASNIELAWNTNPNTNLVANQIYEALRQTYLPNFPSDIDCVAAGHCIIDNNLTSDGILFFTPFNLAIFVANTVATTPAGTSIPIFLDVGVTKLLPFSDAEVTLQLDKAGKGPTAYASSTSLGVPGKSCTYQIGMTYAQFEADCVQPYPNADLNKAAQAKLLGALAHQRRGLPVRHPRRGPAVHGDARRDPGHRRRAGAERGRHRVPAQHRPVRPRADRERLHQQRRHAAEGLARPRHPHVRVGLPGPQVHDREPRGKHRPR